MSTDDKPYQATPSTDLRQQIMDSRVPKNEREWWASRTIEQLETELAAAKLDAEDQAKWALRYLARAEKAEAELAKRDSEYLRGTKMVVESASVWQTRAEKAEAKIITARSALSRIANSDYRGNRSTESQIAFAALEEIK